MLFKIAAVALATALGSFAAQADISGPSSLPPAGFKGQQFVDSRGCIFLKAGYGGQVTWVARVSRDRKPLCGFPPTFGPQPAIEVAETAPVAPAKPAAVKPAPVAVATAKPAAAALTPPVIKPAAVAVAAAPAAAGKPVRSYEVVAGSGVPKGKIGCYSDAPVAERVKLRNGGSVLVCTTGDGGLSGWRPPLFPDGSPVGAALNGAAPQTAGNPVATAQSDATVVPKGYTLAWKDDRLNPLRGKGTAAGQADQDQVWTTKVPAKLVAVKAQKSAPQVTVSTKSAATDPVAAQPQANAAAYVQVGTFGQPENAKGAAARLKALGLPVAISKMTKGGKALQIVLAGPFGSGAEAQQALSALRGSGFGDAFIR